RSAAARRPTACNFISTRRRITGAGSFVCARSGSATFSAAVRSVSRPLPWSRTPMDLRDSSSARRERGNGAPSSSTEPAAGSSSPVSAASRVDLPLPEGPSTAVTLPRGTVRSMPSRITRPPRSRRRPDRRTMGVASLMGAIVAFPGDRAIPAGATGLRHHSWMPTAHDFRLYHSNALDVLAGLLAEELRAPAPGQPLLAPDTILVPQVSMRRWLQATLAERHGIAANLEFLTPGEFVARALQANPGVPAGPELDADSLHWHLYAALRDPALRARPAMAQLAAYRGGDAAFDSGGLKPWPLAGERARVFGKYQAWRRDWLLRWEAGADPDDPQAILWRAVASGHDHRARRIQEYLAR